MRQNGPLCSLVRLGIAAATAVTMLACSGCSTAPDTRCLSGRPTWSHNDDLPVRTKKTTDAKRWDRHCTLVGVISTAAAGR